MRGARVLARAGLAVAAVAGAARRVAGQPRGARIEGVVVEARTTTSVVGATVFVAGRATPVLTDSAGRFRLDSLRPGEQVLTATTPGLDALGLDPTPQRVAIALSAVARVVLALPSSAAVRTLVCPTGGAADTTTALIYGNVGDADGGVVAGAAVAVEWDGWRVGKGGLRADTLRSSVRSDSAGVYRLCGVPRAVALRVTARAPGDRGAAASVAVPAGPAFAVQTDVVLDLDAGAARVAAAAPRAAVLVGLITGAGGRPVPGALVRVLDGAAHTPAATDAALPAVRTDSLGAFRLASARAGTRAVEVRAVGYAPATARVDLRRGDTVRVRLALAPPGAAAGAPTLDTVRVGGRGDDGGRRSRATSGAA